MHGSYRFRARPIIEGVAHRRRVNTRSRQNSGLFGCVYEPLSLGSSLLVRRKPYVSPDAAPPRLSSLYAVPFYSYKTTLSLVIFPQEKFWLYNTDVSFIRFQRKKKTIDFGPPTLVGTGPIRSSSLVIISYYYYPFFSKTALTIFLKLCTILDIDKRKKVTKPDFPKKFRFINYS